MKTKLAKISFLAILLSLIFYSIAQACTLIEPTIVVKCSNGTTPIRAFESRQENEALENFHKREANKTIENLHAVISNCKEDLSPVLNEFEKEVVLWLKKDKRILLDGNLILEPYSTDRDTEIQKSKNNLLLCEYQESKHVGNWLIVFYTGRPYCHPFWYAGHGGMCPIVVMSLVGFLFYLVTNLSLTTLPYLAGWLLASGTIIYAWWMFLKNRPALEWWKALVLTIITLVVSLFLIIPPFWISGQVIGWVLVFGLMVLWYKQRESISKQKTG